VPLATKHHCSVGAIAFVLCLSAPCLAKSPQDAQVEAFAMQERTAPSLSDQKNQSTKNFSYYTYRRMKTYAAAFANWMNAPVLAKEQIALDESTVRMGAEFRAYVLSHYERADADWRKKCTSPTELEHPNLLVYQIALLFFNDEPPKDTDWSDTSFTQIALAKAMFTRCMGDKF
jgi:hypothetical protein